MQCSLTSLSLVGRALRTIFSTVISLYFFLNFSNFGLACTSVVQNQYPLQVSEFLTPLTNLQHQSLGPGVVVAHSGELYGSLP